MKRIPVCYFRMIEGAILSLGSPLGWILLLFLTSSDPIAAIRSQPLLFTYLTFGTLIVFSGFGYYAGTNEMKMASLSRKDFLTGLDNVRSFHENLARAIDTAKREQEDLCLLFFDIDHFKSINDNYGHAFGDLVLKQLAAQINISLRASELTARVGGEEFAVILPKRDLQQSIKVAMRLISDIRDMRISDADIELKITVSIGIASFDGKHSADELYNAADQQMYLSKQNGRDRISYETAPKSNS